MLSKNNLKEVTKRDAQRTPHYGLRKLSIGVASVLLSTTLYAGVSAQADTLNQSTNAAATDATQAPGGNSSTAVPVSTQLYSNSNSQSNAVNQPAAATDTVVPMSGRVPSSENTSAILSTQPQSNANKPVSTTDTAPNFLSNFLVRPVLKLAAQSTTSDLFAGGGVIDNWGNMNDPNPHKASPINFAKWNKGLPSRTAVVSHAYINGVNVNISQIFNVAYANTLSYGTPGKIRTSGRVAWNSVVNGKAYSDGNGSAYNSSTTTDISNFGYGVPQYYWRINGSGNPQVAIVYDLKTLYESSHPGEKFDDSILGRTLTEVYNVTSDGSIEHLFYITNKATRTNDTSAYDKFPNADKYHYYRDFLTLQLELFGDNNLPVFSDGNGGAITSKNGYTVFAQPMFGVQVASHQAVSNNPRNTPHYTLLNNVPSGTKTLNGDVPAAVDYIFKQRIINPGETYVYGFKETVMPSLDIQKQGIIKVSYTDKNGNELAKGKSETLNLRSKYQVNALEIPGYYLTSMPVNASGTVGFGITDIKFIYEKGYIATVKYVDDEKGGAQVGATQTLKGTTGSKVATNIKAPTNYVLSGTYPTEYTFTAAANQQLVVHLKHAKQSVNDQKRVTRTVNYIDPTTKRTKSVTAQTVTLQRTGTKDLVTNKTNWNNWNRAQWAKVGAPNVTGYRVTNPDAAAAMTVTSGTSNTTVTFTYVSDHQASSIVYVDDDKGGTQVKTVPLGGNTGETVKTNIVAPSGYVLSGTYPSEYTFKPSGNMAITVHLKHAKQSVNDQKTVTRTVNYTNPKTGQTKLVKRQTVTLHRTGTKDLVTNSTNWNAWSTAQFKAVNAQSVAGYHVINGNAAGILTVTDQSKDTTVTFTYTANAQTTHVKYVDKDNPSSVIHTTTISGKTDQTVSVPSEVPAGWQLVSGQSVPKNVTFTATGYPDTTVKIEHKHITIASDHPKRVSDKLPDNPAKSYPSGVGQNDLNKTIIRIIQVVDPHTQKVTTTPQSVHLTRTADVDEVSGTVTYGKWTTGEWPVFNTPSVAGYTPTQANVVKTAVTDTARDQTVKITYNANVQTTHVKYVDKDNLSNVIHTTNINGKTDQTVSVPSEVPAGWQLVSGQSVPKNVTFTATGYPDTIVKIEHRHITVTPDHSKTTNDKLPDNPTKSYPAGVGQNDLNKTIVRTIHVVDPHTQKVAMTPQTVHLTRTANVDEVSGAVTYGKWTTGEWPVFNVPSVAGYMPTQANVVKTAVTDTTRDQTVKITYNANTQTTHVKYVDKDNSSSVIHTTNVSGKTDQTVSVPSEVPAGWQLVSGQSMPKNVTFTATGYPDTNVKIEHKHIMVTPDHPKTTNDKMPDNPTKSYPAGVGQNDLNKTITRTIQVVDPHTQKIATTPQSVHLTRTADVDEVSGAVTYGKWTTGEWPIFNTPSVAGYTPTQANVAKVTVTDTTKDQTVKITYAANPQSTTVNYVDSGNQVIHSTAIKGVTDQTVSVPNEVPTGWKLSNGSTVPTNLTFGSTGYPVVTVHIEHQHVTVTPDHPKTPSDKLPNNPTKSYPAGVGQNDLNKTLTRTIQVVDPHTQKVTATTQPVHLTRTADVDEVDGTVTYGKWTTGEWPTFNVPGVAGYTPSQASINQTTVTDTTKDQTIKVIYTANAQTTQVNYVDQSGKVVHSTLIKGVTDQTVTVPNEVPANWQLVSGQTVPSQLTFGPDGHPAVTVKIEHQVKTVQEQKTITRMINYVAANGTPLKPATVQRLSFMRTGVQDLVTKAITWNSTPNQSFAAVNNLDILGYKPDITTVPAVTVNWDTQNSIVDVHYQVAKSTVTVNLVDTQGHVIVATPITGQVGSTVAMPVSIPDGWVVYNADLPARVVIGSRPAELDYLIAHRLVLVKASDNVKAGDLILGTKTKTFNDQVNVNNLITHAAYTVNVWADEAHTQKLTTKTYHTDFTRDALVDAVTGDVYYYNWSEGGKHTFAGFTRPAGNGYQAVVAPAWMATPANPNKTLDLVAQPQQAAGTIRYQTMDGAVVFSQDFAGNKAVTLTAPKGYTLMTNVAAITPALGQGQIYTVYVRPTATLYTAVDQRPAGVESLRKTVTRTIRITEANGHVRTIKQRVRFTRTATVKADGSIVYSAWRATGRAVWNKVFLPKRHGYHVVIDGDFAKMNVTADMSDLTVNVKYVKD